MSQELFVQVADLEDLLLRVFADRLGITVAEAKEAYLVKWVMDGENAAELVKK
jgi:hypothetical protein